MSEFILEIVCVIAGLIALGFACVRWLSAEETPSRGAPARFRVREVVMSRMFNHVADFLAYVCIRFAFGLFIAMILCALPVMAAAASVAWIFERFLELVEMLK